MYVGLLCVCVCTGLLMCVCTYECMYVHDYVCVFMSQLQSPWPVCVHDYVCVCVCVLCVCASELLFMSLRVYGYTL